MPPPPHSLCDLAQFPSDSFDLVRMSYLGLALNKGSWRNVLSDVRRILTVSGRIEVRTLNWCNHPNHMILMRDAVY